MTVWVKAAMRLFLRSHIIAPYTIGSIPGILEVLPCYPKVPDLSCFTPGHIMFLVVSGFVKQGHISAVSGQEQFLSTQPRRTFAELCRRPNDEHARSDPRSNLVRLVET